MSIPSIAEVRAAADKIINGPGRDTRQTPEIVLLEEAFEHAETLAAFALAILNAPGMTAERLDTIHRHINECRSYHCSEFDPEEAAELIAEVLRQRAEIGRLKNEHVPFEPPTAKRDPFPEAYANFHAVNPPITDRVSESIGPEPGTLPRMTSYFHELEDGRELAGGE